jgi:ATP-dependent DNA helicase RecG
MGILDPNPEICGKGELLLRENSVLVEHFPAELQLKVEKLNKKFMEELKKKQPVGEAFPIEPTSLYEKEPICTASIGDLSLEAIRFYLDRIGSKIKVPSNELWQFFLKKNFLTTSKDSKTPVPTVAGLLLFGKAPETFLVQSKIKADRYLGTSPVDTFDHRDIKGSLPTMIDEAERFFLMNMREAMKIEGFSRIQTTEYPKEVLREAVRNAIVHRDYTKEGATVMIKFFSDRVIVESPGLLPSPLTLDKIRSLNYKPVSRNPIIARAMVDMGFMEERGAGIKIMHDIMLKYGLKPPEFNYDSGYFTVTFYGPGEKVLDLVSETREKTTQKILYAIKKKPTITKKELAGIVGITEDGIKYHLKVLKKKGIIKRRGSGKGGYWEIVKDTKS